MRYAASDATFGIAMGLWVLVMGGLALENAIVLEGLQYNNFIVHVRMCTYVTGNQLHQVNGLMKLFVPSHLLQYLTLNILAGMNSKQCTEAFP